MKAYDMVCTLINSYIDDKQFALIQPLLDDNLKILNNPEAATEISKFFEILLKEREAAEAFNVASFCLPYFLWSPENKQPDPRVRQPAALKQLVGSKFDTDLYQSADEQVNKWLTLCSQNGASELKQQLFDLCIATAIKHGKFHSPYFKALMDIGSNHGLRIQFLNVVEGQEILQIEDGSSHA